MDTVRVDIAYRPLRIAWAVHSEDRAALDKVVRLTHATWGGRFNPIVLVDRPEEAKQFIEMFRADVICPIGDCEEVRKFPGKYPHLIDPFYGDVFRKTGQGEGQAQVLDMHNAITHWHGTPTWKALEDGGIRVFKWDEDDPLAWPFLMQLGAYPNPDEIGVDYAQIFASATVALHEGIDKSQPIPTAVLDHPSIGYLTRHRLTRHHAVPGRWEYHGFFVGNASNVLDLVSFWNLRAVDLGFQFIDPEHLARYAKIIPHHIELLTPRLAHLREHERRTAVWGRPEVMEQAQSALSGRELTICRLGPGVWNGLNVQAPMMILGEESSLGVLNREREKPRVSFAMKDKPFNGDTWFYAQHLVASVSMIGGLFGDDHFTYHAPYVPELNEFFARTMHFEYNAIRVEPGRIGIVIDAADHDAFLDALPTAELIERVFNMAKVRPKLSGGGLIARQLLARLGGVSNARVFKVAGARRPLKTFGPNDTFTRSGALQLIGKKDPENPQASFKDHEDL